MEQFAPTAEQQAVIAHRGAHALVFAGPGTGKTETLARRFASIVADDGVDPSKIVVLTFSRRAADEMRARIMLRLRQRLGRELAVSELFVRTFHSFCSRLLDAEAPRLSDDALLTPMRERLLWEEVIAGPVELRFFDAVRASRQFAVDALNFITQIKGQGVTPDRLEEIAGGDARLADLARLYRALDELRARRGLRDYRDLVLDGVRQLGDPDSAATRWLRQHEFRHVLVDEFQDSDAMQLQLLLTIAGDAVQRENPVPEFCFVGDVNQSIYRFRGATPANVDAAQRRFRCVSLPLTANRRSAQAILDVANRDSRLDKISLTRAEDTSRPGTVSMMIGDTLETEIETLCDRIAAEVGAGTPPSHIAVLLRQTQPYQSAISRALLHRGIPVAPSVEAGFEDDPLIDAVATALRLTDESQAPELWTRLLTNPVVGYGALSVRMAFDSGRRSGIYDPAAALAAAPPRGPRPIDEFLDGWHRCLGIRRRAEPVVLIRALIKELRLLDAAAAAQAPLGYDPIASPQRLNALLLAARDYGESASARPAPEATSRFIAHLGEILETLTDATQPPPAGVDGVRVMTIHAAKGLEFTCVAVPQLLEGVLPARVRSVPLLSESALDRLSRGDVRLFAAQDDQLREESSLWYVALTRAKTTVLASAPRFDDKGVELQLSPFAGYIERRDGAAAAHLGIRRPSRRLVAVAREHKAASADVRRYAAVRPVFETIVYENTATPLIPAAPQPFHLHIERISPSGIGRYVTCPRRYFYRDILRLPGRRDDDAASLGSAVHATLRRFHEEARDFSTPLSPAEIDILKTVLRALAREELDVLALKEGMTPDAGLIRYQRAMITDQLERYLDRLAHDAASHPFTVLGCETHVESNLNGAMLSGNVDRVDRLAAGGLAIRDYQSGVFYKSSAVSLSAALSMLDGDERIFGSPPERLTLQTLLYIPGVERTFGETVRRVDYIYLRGKDEESPYIDSVAITDSDNERDALGALAAVSPADARRVITDIAARIVAECESGNLTGFSTTTDPEACRFCDFVDACPGAGTIGH